MLNINHSLSYDQCDLDSTGGMYLSSLPGPSLRSDFPAYGLLCYNVMLQYGGFVGGIAAMSTIGPQLVSVPPYLWGSDAGLINVGGVIGTLLGGFATYAEADRRLKSIALREEDGLAEPETRLPIIFPSLFLAPSGMLVYGFIGEFPGDHRWLGLQFRLGMLSFGLMQIPSIGFNHVGHLLNGSESHCVLIL